MIFFIIMASIIVSNKHKIQAEKIRHDVEVAVYSRKHFCFNCAYLCSLKRLLAKLHYYPTACINSFAWRYK